ncbi:MAG TPA: class I SAM-dependent methyltransferase [Bradyrhizobium sp.]|nr:class I SAM-dependent methyltransferase [Bradyrhizobium sp.]
MPSARSAANLDVLEFYRHLPFNYRGSARDHAKTIKSINQITSYAPLVPLLRKGTSFLDVGCGAGWLGLSASHHYRCNVTGIDFNPVAIERAREVGRALGTTAEFHVADLFQFESGVRYDVVASMGVLHHTDDCHAGVRRLCDHFVRPGGVVVIGLYHRHGRRPFLDHFEQMKRAGASESDMLGSYRRLHASLTDEVHLMSWFRDQVLHPHETQHTLCELLPVLEASEMEIVSTSINGFARFDSIEQLCELEPQLEQVGAERLMRGQYYPGFFVFLARKK